MSARLLAVRRGKVGENQSFSRARDPVPATNRLIQDALGPTANVEVRRQLFGDPGSVCQFAICWGQSVGFLTRPRVVDRPVGDGGPIVVGHFTDTIGEPCPVSVSLDNFTGFVTTLVRRADAEALGLGIHPTPPDAVRGPPVVRVGAEGGMERSSCGETMTLI